MNSDGLLARPNLAAMELTVLAGQRLRGAIPYMKVASSH